MWKRGEGRRGHSTRNAYGHRVCPFGTFSIRVVLTLWSGCTGYDGLERQTFLAIAKVVGRRRVSNSFGMDQSTFTGFYLVFFCPQVRRGPSFLPDSEPTLVAEAAGKRWTAGRGRIAGDSGDRIKEETQRMDPSNGFQIESRRWKKRRD